MQLLYICQVAGVACPSCLQIEHLNSLMLISVLEGLQTAAITH